MCSANRASDACAMCVSAFILVDTGLGVWYIIYGTLQADGVLRYPNSCLTE